MTSDAEVENENLATIQLEKMKHKNAVEDSPESEGEYEEETVMIEEGMVNIVGLERVNIEEIERESSAPTKSLNLVLESDLKVEESKAVEGDKSLFFIDCNPDKNSTLKNDQINEFHENLKNKECDSSQIQSESKQDDDATSNGKSIRKKLSFYHDHKNICRNWNTWGCNEDHSSVTNRHHICLSCGKDHPLIMSECNVIKADPALLVKAHVAHCKNRFFDPFPQKSEENVTSEPVKRNSCKAVPEEFGNKVTFEGDPVILSTLPAGSKLQILNLPLTYPIEDKQDLAAIFSQYGEIYDISFTTMPKVIHGFIQFGSPEILTAALKAEDRREMKLGFKLDLVDELKRSQEKANLSTRTVEPKQRKEIPRDNRKGAPSSANNSSRKREASPVSHRNKKGGSGNRDQFRRDNSPDTRNHSNRLTGSDSFRFTSLYTAYNTAVPGVHDVQLIGLDDVLDSFVEQVESRCTQANLRWKTTFLSFQDDIYSKVRQFHQMGVSGIIFVERKGEKDRTVAVQIFPLNNQSKEFAKLSISEAVVCVTNEKKARDAANPSNQLAQFLSLAAQANVPVEQILNMASGANANQFGQVPLGNPTPQYSALPNMSYPSYQQQSNPSNMQAFNYGIAPQQQQQQQIPSNMNPVQNISGMLNAFASNQSLLNNLNLLNQQQNKK